MANDLEGEGGNRYQHMCHSFQRQQALVSEENVHDMLWLDKLTSLAF